MQRILKVFYSNVFYVFNGSVGPTALANDDQGNLYVSIFEYQNKDETIKGLTSVLNKDGYLIGKLELQKMFEITGKYFLKKFIDEFKE